VQKKHIYFKFLQEAGGLREIALEGDFRGRPQGTLEPNCVRLRSPRRKAGILVKVSIKEMLQFCKTDCIFCED
jgi:hypothetical protein